MNVVGDQGSDGAQQAGEEACGQVYIDIRELPYAKGDQVMCPVAIGELGGAELGKDGGGVGGGGGGGEGGALDLRHVGHHVVRGGAHHRDALISVLHLGAGYLQNCSQNILLRRSVPQGHWRTE